MKLVPGSGSPRRPSAARLLGFFALQYSLLVLLMAGFRLFFLVKNAGEAQGVPSATLLQSFAVGWQFDTAVACYLLLLDVVLHLLQWGLGARRRERALWLARRSATGAASFAVFFALVADAEHFRELGVHLTAESAAYLTSPGEIVSTIWTSMPVFTDVGLAALASAVFVFATLRAARTLSEVRAFRPAPHALALLLMAALSVVGARGGLGSGVLRWGRAYFSEHAFANQLALNGAFTLVSSWADARKAAGGSVSLRRVPRERAEALVREAYDEGDARFVVGPNPLLRVTDTGRPERRLNLVVILLENWSAEHVGAVGGSPTGTPRFDELSKKGLLFTRLFATGTRTNRGLASTLFGFPAQVRTSILQRLGGVPGLAGLSEILGGRGYASSFFYGGDLDFDNMRGFLAAHGVREFVGMGDFPRSAYLNRWGASDSKLFERVAENLGRGPQPFFATVLTLSSHEPFDLPPEAQVLREGEHPHADYLNALRYSDEALARFLDSFGRTPAGRNTVFLLVSDHAKKLAGQSGVDWRRFRIPALLYAPGIVPPGVNEEVASQADLLPTVMHFLGGAYEASAWGRDLVRENRRNFAVVAHGDEWGVATPDGYYTEDGRGGVRVARLPWSVSQPSPGRAAEWLELARAVIEVSHAQASGRPRGDPR